MASSLRGVDQYVTCAPITDALNVNKEVTKLATILPAIIPAINPNTTFKLSPTNNNWVNASNGPANVSVIFSIDLFRNFLHNKALVINMVKAYKRSCLLALIKYSTGSYSYILAPDGLQPGFFVKTLIKPLNCSLGYKLGFEV
jgi:hypothetical protein